MTKKILSLVSAAFFLTLGSSAIASTMSKAEYGAAKKDINTKYQVNQKNCKSMSGNTKDICNAEAKALKLSSEAELEAKNNPSAKHQYDVRIAKAEGSYAVAKEKCDDLAGNAKDVCRKEAESAFIAAKADAKVSNSTSENNTTAREKTNEANQAAHEKNTDVRKDAAAEKRDAEYSVAKEKCDSMSGTAKENCINDAKAHYQKN